MSEEGDATGGVIPYKNVPALVAYYLAIFSLLPCIGLPFGIGALVLGFFGLKRRAECPEAKGSVHAWIGIILGGITTIINGGIVLMMFLGAASHR